MNLLVFAGTTEGSDFVQKALAEGHTITVSVATQYGSEVLQKHLSSLSETSSGDADSERLHILQGRLENFQRILARLGADCLESVINDALRDALLTGKHHLVDKLRDCFIVIHGIRQHIALRY